MDLTNIKPTLKGLYDYLEECKAHVREFKEHPVGDGSLYELWADRLRSTKVLVAALEQKKNKYFS